MKLRHSHIVFLSSFGFAIAAVVGLTILLLMIKNQGSMLQTYVTAIGDQLAQEKKYHELQSLVKNTSEERSALGEYILTEDETISFLTSLEEVARQQGVTYTTDNLRVESAEGEQFQKLVMQFTVAGSVTQIQHIIKMLETMPYHSQLTNMDWRFGDEVNSTLIIGVVVSMEAS